MSVRLGHASLDENGRISGGEAGDQTGREVCIVKWYSKPWSCVLRCKDSDRAERMAEACEAACGNDNIGYDQYQRLTLNKRAAEVGHKLEKINTPCECDCSSLMCECALAAGINISPALTTAVMQLSFAATGQFEVLTETRYTASDKYLKRGDILLRPGSHTAMVLDDGELSDAGNTARAEKPKIRAARSFDRALAGRYRVTASTLNVRSGPGTGYAVISALHKDDRVRCYGFYDGDWLYVVCTRSEAAWVSRKWLERV